MKIKLLCALSIVAFAACNSNQKQADETQTKKEDKIIGKKDLKVENGLMTPEALWAFGRVSDVKISPDGKTILYGVTFYDIAENKGNRELYTIGTDGSNPQQISSSFKSEQNAVWRPDGKKIGFLSSEEGSMQLWECDPDGKNRKRISDVDGGITGFNYSPDQKKIFYSKEIKIDKTVQDIYPDLDKSDGRIMTNLMYRHWDSWVDSYSHIFIADYNGEGISNDADILKGMPYDSPLKPFGGIEQLCWSPDNKSLAFTCKMSVGKDYALSTNSDIFIYNLETKETKNMTQGMMGYDIAPVYSPDGKMIAWESMERDGYESDKNRLFIYDFEKDTRTDYTKDFDQNAEGLAWTKDGKSVYFNSDYHGRHNIHCLDIGEHKIVPVTQGTHNCLSVAVAEDKLIITKQSMSLPTEIYAVNPADGKETQLTFTNKELLGQLKMGNVEERWIKTTDGKQMLTWVIYPPDFDKNKKYPTLLYCQGGPQSSVSQFFSYRWNFQLMAANGYIIVAPNRRGVPGFGKEWNEQISGDYGGQNMKDYFSAIDEVAKEPFVDKDHLGAVGASYGGFSVFWMAGHHNKRFKAFIAHDGIFNMEAQYLETEEMFFANWDIGGPFWDKSNKIAQNTYANSPHRFVDKWDTPILVIHSEKDYRIVASQGMSAFNAAQLRGIPSEYLYFPEENHWVLTPQNSILWQRTFFKWLDKWLK